MALNPVPDPQKSLPEADQLPAKSERPAVRDIGSRLVVAEQGLLP